jgi:hypothetical protein
MKLITTGREDISAYFCDVVLVYKRLVHTPLLAFIPDGEAVTVRLISDPALTLELPDTTPMMGQWQGQYSSDFFKFTAGQLKDFIKDNPSKVLNTDLLKEDIS